MKLTIDKVKRSILNKWDWENPINNVSVFLWGPIGIGKTEIVQQTVAERMLHECNEKLKTEQDINKIQKLQIRKTRLESFKSPKEIIDLLEEHLLMIRLAERNLELLTGFPCPVPAEKNMIFLMPESMTKIKEDSWCVVFLDELDKADSAKLCATTNITEARRIGDFFFPKDTFIIVAANRVQDSILSQPIPSELRNRAFHIEVETSATIWCNWAIKNKIRQDVVDFISYRKMQGGKDNISTTKDTTLAEASNAFLTPRTLTMGANHLDKLDKLEYSFEEMVEEFGGFVGDDIAEEYKAYIQLYSKVNIMNILNGIEKIPKINGNVNTVNANIKNALSAQYIYSFAIGNKLKADMLTEQKHFINLATAINELNPNIKVILLSALTNDNELCEKVLSNPQLETVITNYLNSMKKAMQ